MFVLIYLKFMVMSHFYIKHGFFFCYNDWVQWLIAILKGTYECTKEEVFPVIKSQITSEIFQEVVQALEMVFRVHRGLQ